MVLEIGILGNYMREQESYSVHICKSGCHHNLGMGTTPHSHMGRLAYHNHYRNFDRMTFYAHLRFNLNELICLSSILPYFLSFRIYYGANIKMKNNRF